MSTAVDICERQSDLSTSRLEGLIDGPIKSSFPRDITQMAPHLYLNGRLASEEDSGQPAAMATRMVTVT